jgi:hypothetical protein
MSLLGDELASADVRLATSSRVWRIRRSRLDEAKTRQPELFGIIEVALALSLRAKLIAANDRLVGKATGPLFDPGKAAGLSPQEV